MPFPIETRTRPVTDFSVPLPLALRSSDLTRLSSPEPVLESKPANEDSLRQNIIPSRLDETEIQANEDRLLFDETRAQVETTLALLVERVEIQPQSNQAISLLDDRRQKMTVFGSMVLDVYV